MPFKLNTIFCILILFLNIIIICFNFIMILTDWKFTSQ